MGAIKLLTVYLTLAAGVAADHLDGLPTVPFTPADGDRLDASKLTRIVVDGRYAGSRDTEGETLIPPTLQDFAETFADDLTSLGHGLDLDLIVIRGDEDTEHRHSILLTLGDPSQYLNAAGSRTSEGYTLNVTEDRVVVSGASPLGVWWGTRTLLQQLVLGNGSLPRGHGVDSPGWPVRGLMVCKSVFAPLFAFGPCLGF